MSLLIDFAIEHDVKMFGDDLILVAALERRRSWILTTRKVDVGIMVDGHGL